MLADLETVTKQRERVGKEAKRGDKDAMPRSAVAGQAERSARAPAAAPSRCSSRPRRQAIARQFFLLTTSPRSSPATCKDTDLATADAYPYVIKVRDYVKTHLSCEAVVISAQIESELIDLAPDEADTFLKELGVAESGVGSLIRATYHLLGLRTYFTAGEKEVRAWTIHTGDTAPKAAGVIHSDFERGFIKAETVAYDDLVACGSIAAAREKGLYRMEGKDYVVKDGDVLLFKFNV